MEEAKQNEAAYSGEHTEITGPDALRSTSETTESLGSEKTPSKQAQTAQKLIAPEISQTTAAGTMVAESLKRTKRVWLIVAGAILGMMGLLAWQWCSSF